ncbi:MAG: LamG domain-containing protein [Candidatus Moranbacteria bacterium]|nr:LamG domain-containing protein [Candidatus Moranbacteria bacterium]
MDPATDWTDGQIGAGLDFDGVDDYVDLTSLDFTSIANENAMTFGGWVKITGDITAADYTMGGNYDGHVTTAAFVLYSDYGGDGVGWRAGVADSNGFVDGVLTSTARDTTKQDTWQHIIMTWDGIDLKLYVDGTLDDTASGSLSINDVDYTAIGRQGVYDAKNMQGQIDEVRIYNRALSEGEIERLYKLTRPKIKAPTRDGLVGYWSMEEGSGTQVGDMSGNGNHGTMQNMDPATDWVTGKYGQGLDFDGSDDYVDANIPEISSVPLSVSFWMKPNDGTWRSILKISDGGLNVCSFGFDGTVNRYKFKMDADGDDTSIADTLNSLNKWVHVTATVTDEEVRLYRNADLRGTSSWPKTMNLNVLNIGDSPLASDLFQGKIDEVRIYNRALSEGEIETLYESGQAKLNSSQTDRLTDGLVGMWSFDGPDIAGTTAYDRSSGANHGTLTNGPQKTIGKVGQGLDFDGVDDNVTISANSAFEFGEAENWSVSLWTKYTDSNCNGNKVAVGRYNGRQWWIGCQGSEIAGGTLRDSDGVQQNFEGTTLLNDNQWHHLLLTVTRRVDNDRIDFYVDGNHEKNENPDFTGNFDIGADLFFGTFTGSDYLWSGQIDEARIYNRALSEDEIQRLYNMGR